VALRDAVLATGKPFVEVHLSNPDAREPFRQRSLLADIALGRIAGLGAVGYELALRGLAVHLSGTSGLLSTPTNH
jgi:3-dehydroquinate dehydratase-2